MIVYYIKTLTLITAELKIGTLQAPASVYLICALFQTAVQVQQDLRGARLHHHSLLCTRGVHPLRPRKNEVMFFSGHGICLLQVGSES